MSEKIPDMAIDLFKYHIDLQMERGLCLRTRVFTLTGEVNLDMFHRVEACLNIFEQEPEAITIRLCSQGGEIYSALAIIGRIKASPNHIRIEAYGQIMSAATAIFASADERISDEWTSFMFHQTSITVPDSKLRDAKAEIAQSERDDEVFNDILARYTQMDSKYWHKLIQSGRNVYFTAAQCAQLGLVDKII